MEFAWTTIYVKNMEESLKFYQEILGLPLKRRFANGPNLELAFLGEGDTEVELIVDATKPEVHFGKDISMGFFAGSLDQIYPVLEAYQIPIYAGPIQPGPHMRFIYILDPNGVKIQLIERL